MDGKFGLAEFNREYKLVRASLRSGDTSDIEAAQQQLRFLVPGLPTDHDRTVAEDLITDLPALLVDPPPHSPEMTEALHVLNTADLESGTVEQQLVAIDRTRKQIWAIADRAGGRDSANIRSLTRMLERREDSLTEPWPWPEATADPT